MWRPMVVHVGFVVEKVAGFSPSVLVFLHTHSASGAGTVGLFEIAIPRDPFSPSYKGKRELIHKYSTVQPLILFVFILS
jgi:hypothetical protein